MVKRSLPYIIQQSFMICCNFKFQQYLLIVSFEKLITRIDILDNTTIVCWKRAHRFSIFSKTARIFEKYISSLRLKNTFYIIYRAIKHLRKTVLSLNQQRIHPDSGLIRIYKYESRQKISLLCNLNAHKMLHHVMLMLWCEHCVRV